MSSIRSEPAIIWVPNGEELTGLPESKLREISDKLRMLTRLQPEVASTLVDGVIYRRLIVNGSPMFLGNTQAQRLFGDKGADA